MAYASSLILLVASLGIVAAQPGDPNVHDRITTLGPGTVIPVRTSEAIDPAKGDARVYAGVVDRDVRNGHDRVIVPRGSAVELMVRRTPADDLELGLDSIVVNGQRYALRANQRSVPSHPDQHQRRSNLAK